MSESGSELKRLHAQALYLRRHGPKRKGARALPALWFVTDPDRTPDPARTAARLPKGCGLIFRGFGRPEAVGQARRLAATAKRRGLVLLIGQDEPLAARVGAAGVHLPERLQSRAPRIAARHRDWIITSAAHGRRALHRAGGLGIHMVLISAVFPSRSPSASRPLGVVRLAALVRAATCPVAALGGVNARTIARLRGTGVVSVAAVEGIRT